MCLTVIASFLAVSDLSAATRYVSLGSTNPVPPYTNWATAATVIQDAVDAAAAGDEVVVADGTHANGGRAVGTNDVDSRVVVDKPLRLRTVSGPELTVIDGGGTNRCVYLANGASLSGFTLRNGLGFRGMSAFPPGSGGGVWCASTNASLTNCTLTGNRAWFGGGAYGGTLYNCRLTSNDAAIGGGAVSCLLSNCALSSNSTWKKGDGGGPGGGAASCTLIHCTLSGNNAYADGGGGANGGTLYNCALSSNNAAVGGGASGCTLSDCTLNGNYAGSGGGAFGCTLNNCTLTSNNAGSGGGAGGSTLNNCTLTGNGASWAGGGASGILMDIGVEPCTLNNCLVYFNASPSGAENYDAHSTLNYCCTTPMPTNGVGNITGDPLFVDYANGNLRLQPNSPCIDAGNIAYAPGPVDLDGNPRIVNGTVDIGAYELQVPRPSNGPPVFLRQPTSVTSDAGTTVTFSVDAGGSQPLSFQWLRGGMALAEGGNRAGTCTWVLTLTNVLGADAGGYSVVVSNGLGSATSAVATLEVIDPLIAVQPLSQVGQLGQTLTLSVTASGTAPFAYQWWKDGAALAWGTWASLTLTNFQGGDGGQYYVVVSNHYGSATSAVALLTTSLITLDTGFDPGANNTVGSLAVQADGKILVGGGFTTLGAQTRSYLGRLNADGTVDSGFNPGAGGTTYQPFVSALALQADGKILVGGSFTALGGQSRNFIGRLNADGTVDTSFNPGADDHVASLALQSDGQILVGGWFSMLGGQSRNGIGRLNPDGTVDMSFNPEAITCGLSLALQADGKIVVGGGQSGNYIGRLDADGTVDPSFNPEAGVPVSSLALQADGEILVGGWFSMLGGQSRNYIGRLNVDGTVDPSFDPGGRQPGVVPGVAGGREDSGGGRVQDTGWAEPQLHWPPQWRWDSGHELQPWGKQLGAVRGVAVGREDSGGGLVQHVRRAEPQLHWPTEQHRAGDPEPEL